jgi:uncharacterized membrane protein YoaK (UPF0700 family)
LRLALLSSIWGSFMFGAIVGTFLYHRLGGRSLLAPVLFLLGVIVTSGRGRTDSPDARNALP